MATKIKRVQYQPVLKLPALPYEQFIALRDNIALNGILVPIIVDSDGPRRKIIDGNYRKAIASELGYDCPEIVQPNLEEEEKRILARALNLARRHLNQEQRRELIADQLEESPDRSNRWIAKQLGVHHATVAAVRAEMESTGQISQLNRTVGLDGRSRSAARSVKIVSRSESERRKRITDTRLIHGDCRKELKKIATASIDAIITDPIYPEVKREYGRMTESQWHEMMRTVVTECRRVLKPKGSAVFVLGPNSERVGKMRLWLWEFVAWAGREWNMVQDSYWWAVDLLPLGGIGRHQGLMRPSVKMCVWLGSPDCFRNQSNGRRRRCCPHVTVPTLLCALAQVVAPIATAASPKPPMSEAGQHHSIACRSQLAGSQALDMCIQQQRPTTLQHGGANTSFPLVEFSSIHFAARERCLSPAWTTEHRR